MSRARTFTIAALACLALAALGGCRRGPGRRLVGQWELDVQATAAEIRQEMADAEEGSAARAMAEALLSVVEMQQRLFTFARDGTVRAVVRAHPDRVPGLGAGVALHREDGNWEVVEADEDTLTLRITGGEREFADWQAVLHFEGDDRFYYHTGAEGNVREYWVRK